MVPSNANTLYPFPPLTSTIFTGNGAVDTAAQEKSTMVLLQSVSDKYFPVANAVTYTCSPKTNEGLIPSKTQFPASTVVVPIEIPFLYTSITVPSTSTEVPETLVAPSPIFPVIIGQADFERQFPALISSKEQGP